MLKHLEDDGNLNIVLNNSGAALLVCGKCKKRWLGTFQPYEKSADSRRRQVTVKLAARPALRKKLGLAELRPRKR